MGFKRKITSFVLFALVFLSIGVLVGLNLQTSPSTGLISREPLEKGSYSAKVNIVAVSSQGTGILNQAEVEISEGEGRVLFNVNPFVEPDTQYSAETAKSVAEKFTGKSCSNKDIIYTVKAGGATLVGGPSAGAALTIATIAAIEENPVNKNIAITGTIQENGGIGQVSGVIEKARAAAQKGVNLFLVPPGQSTAIFYERKTDEKKDKGFIFRRVYYEPVEVDLNKALFEEYGMQVREVASIQEAAEYALQE